MNRNISFDDVVNDLMLEEQKPTKQALLRWTKRFPEYSQDLADFFDTWAVQSALPPIPPTNKEKIVKRGVEYALAIVRQQGQVSSPPPVKALSEFDQMVLTAVFLLRGEGYPVNIAERVGDMTRDRVLLGSALISLDRLERLGLVWSRLGDPVTETQGKTRTYYVATLEGDRLLAKVKQESPLLADFLGDLA